MRHISLKSSLTLHRVLASSLILLCFMLLDASNSLSDFSTQLLYGDTSTFWGTLNDLNRTTYSLSEVNEILDSEFGIPKEGIGRADFEFLSDTETGMKDYFSKGRIGLSAEALAGGIARNRVFPEVKGYGAYSFHTEYGFLEPYDRSESSWNYQLFTLLGIGKVEMVDALAIDLYPRIPSVESFLFFWGAEGTIGYKNIFSSTMWSRNQIYVSPTVFYLDESETAKKFKINHRKASLRWRTESEWRVQPFENLDPIFELGALGISGPQPTPFRPLPKSWDLIHDLETFPSAGQLFGIGSRLVLRNSDSTFSFLLDGGFYGGYLGAGANLQIKNFSLSAGSWGYEQSSGFRIIESRIRYLEVGYSSEI